MVTLNFDLNEFKNCQSIYGQQKVLKGFSFVIDMQTHTRTNAHTHQPKTICLRSNRTGGIK